MKMRTAAGTHLQLKEIAKAKEGRERDAKKKQFGLNGEWSAFLKLPQLGHDFPNCLVPG